jgi:hypothetical protein
MSLQEEGTVGSSPHFSRRNSWASFRDGGKDCFRRICVKHIRGKVITGLCSCFRTMSVIPFGPNALLNFCPLVASRTFVPLAIVVSSVGHTCMCASPQHTPQKLFRIVVHRPRISFESVGQSFRFLAIWESCFFRHLQGSDGAGTGIARFVIFHSYWFSLCKNTCISLHFLFPDISIDRAPNSGFGCTWISRARFFINLYCLFNWVFRAIPICTLPGRRGHECARWPTPGSRCRCGNLDVAGNFLSELIDSLFVVWHRMVRKYVFKEILNADQQIRMKSGLFRRFQKMTVTWCGSE